MHSAGREALVDIFRVEQFGVFRQGFGIEACAMGGVPADQRLGDLALGIVDCSCGGVDTPDPDLAVFFERSFAPLPLAAGRRRGPTIVRRAVVLRWTFLAMWRSLPIVGRAVVSARRPVLLVRRAVEAVWWTIFAAGRGPSTAFLPRLVAVAVH
jgi:hypothetical protein